MSVRPHHWICRCLIELTAPMKIGSGASDDWDDAMIIRDHDKLPYIPGSSLAGTLRAAYESEHGLEAGEAVFGYVKAGGVTDASALVVSQGFIVDSRGNVLNPLSFNPIKDPLLQSAKSEYKRNHVRLSDLGVVDTAGLHDASHLPSGFRFAFELRLNLASAEELAEQATRLVSLLHSPAVTIGGGRGTGLGQFELRSAQSRSFDLRLADDLKLFSAYRSALHVAAPSLYRDERQAAREPKQSVVSWVLKAHISGAWLVAGGDPTDQDARADRVAAMIPWRESRVIWTGQSHGQYQEDQAQAMIPGSSLRGALRHRTAFHLNRLNGLFSDHLAKEDEEALLSTTERRAAIAAYGGLNHRQLWLLFGGLEAGHEDSQAGKVVIEDTWPTQASHGFQDHVTLDRLSGGAYKGNLFDESFMWGGEVTVKVHVYDHQNEVPQRVREALACALHDLERGHLAFGGGTGRGHGHLSPGSNGQWSDQEIWINGGDQVSNEKEETA